MMPPRPLSWEEMVDFVERCVEHEKELREKDMLSIREAVNERMDVVMTALEGHLAMITDLRNRGDQDRRDAIDSEDFARLANDVRTLLDEKAERRGSHRHSVVTMTVVFSTVTIVVQIATAIAHAVWHT